MVFQGGVIIATGLPGVEDYGKMHTSSVTSEPGKDLCQDVLSIQRETSDLSLKGHENP